MRVKITGIQEEAKRFLISLAKSRELVTINPISTQISGIAYSSRHKMIYSAWGEFSPIEQNYREISLEKFTQILLKI